MASKLAAELRLQILESCPDVPTAANLARTSKAFWITWQRCQQKICEQVLERSIDCYEDALYLAQLQPTPPGYKDHVSRILANAKIVENACNALPEVVKDPAEFQQWPTRTERVRFHHVYYLAWATAIYRDNLPDTPLTITNGRETDHLLLFLFWLEILIGRNPHIGAEPPGKDLWMVIWANDHDYYRRVGNRANDPFLPVTISIRTCLCFCSGQKASSGFFQRLPGLIGEPWKLFMDDQEEWRDRIGV
ncbi:MAG: hypothetical protein Q9168_007589 [Polycauliona sp. 1 TL-2023]